MLLAEKCGAKYIHIDVMDGVFVPNVTEFTPDFVSKYHASHGMVNDVHIMVEDPLVLGPIFAKAGADIVTFHLEACEDPEEVFATIKAIKEAGAKVGISIKPGTPVEALSLFYEEVDLILVMSVEPGKGGQPFIEASTDRIKTIKEEIEKRKLSVLIEVDGGINQNTGALCVNAGADILVAGSYLFGHEDIKDRLEALLSL